MDLDGLGNRGIVAADIRHRVASRHRDHARGVGHGVAAADGQLRIVNAIVADGQAVRSQLGNGRVGCRHHTAVAAFGRQFRQRVRNGRLDGILHNVSVRPGLRMVIRTVIIGEGVFHRVGAAVLRTVDLRQHRDDRVAAAVGHRRGRRARHVGDALHAGHRIGGKLKRLGRHLVGVAPRVRDIVDRVGENEGRVAATAGQSAGVHSLEQIYSVTAVGDDREYRIFDFRETVDHRGIVFLRFKLAGNQVEHILPDGVMVGTVAVMEFEGHRSGTVQRHIRNTVHAGIVSRFNLIAAHIMHRRRIGTSHIGKTRLGGTTIRRERIKLSRQLNVVGKFPNLRMSGAIGIRIIEHQVALAAVISRAVDGKRTGGEHVLAGIFHRRQCNARGLGLRQTVHRGILGGRQREVVRNDMPGVFPSVIRIVDRVGIIEHRFATTRVVIHHGILRQGDGIAANNDDRLGRIGLDIALAMNRGVFVSHRREVVRIDRIDELPRIDAARAIGVRIVVGHRTVAVSIHDHHGIAGIRHREDFSLASVRQRVRFRRDRLANTRDFCRSIGGNRQRRQFDNVGEQPIL